MRNDHKICFIMCANDAFLAKECLLYISQLEVPEGFSVEQKVIYGAQSMASGYNKAMKQSDAKYKVYLHQDVLLIHRAFLLDMTALFCAKPQIGMFGVVGNKSLAKDGCPWSDGMHRRIGEIYSDLIFKKEYSVFSKISGSYEHAVVLDGLLMATQYDLPWREDLFQGWDFYDCSQSLEFWKAGYQVVVPSMKTPWCLHDNDILHMEHYEKWRKVFERTYGNDYKNWEAPKKKVIFQIFDPKKTLLDFPYPPVYKEEGADYLCFTDQKEVHSRVWKICKIDSLDRAAVSLALADYEEQKELQTDQIQIAPLFAQKSGEGVVTVPALDQLPDVKFDQRQIKPTASHTGAYCYKKNPKYTKGKYNGRQLLLTIGVPVSNQIETIDRCISHIAPLLNQLDAELVVVDTGSTDGTVEVCRAYGARIVTFAWCDNMSAARNEALYHARGAWFLSIDDDEWFENVDDILGFFQSGTYKKCDTATYIQRNYQMMSGSIFHDNHTLRMARITPELHFEGRIHDSLIVPAKAKNCQLFSVAHHYGFANDDPKKSREKYIRNTSLLLHDLYEYPKKLRYNFQLANELKCERYYADAAAWFFRGISIEQELPSEHFARLHTVCLLSSLHDSKDERTFFYTNLLQDRCALTAAEKAFLNYNAAELALIMQKPSDQILEYCRQYEKYKKAYHKNPYDSQQRTYLGLQACTNESYLTDAHVIAFCAYVKGQQEREALLELGRIDMDKMYNQHGIFFETVLLAGDEIYHTVIERLSPFQWEKWQEKLLDAFFVSISRHAFYKRQFARFAGFAKRFSVQGITDYMRRFYNELTPSMHRHLSKQAADCRPYECSVQELAVYAYVLKEKYKSEGKKAQDMELFAQYIKVTGAFAAGYYHPGLLNDAACSAVQADYKAAYLISLVLQDRETNSENIRMLKQAVQIFPGFKSEVQYLLTQMVQQKLAVQDGMQPWDEMLVLAHTLKRQIQKLLDAGNKAAAKPMLLELAGYFPDDAQIQAMLEEVEG